MTIELSRREVLIGCSAALGAMAGTGVRDLAFAAPADTSRRDILVVVFLRGGCDGLNLVAPVDDRSYAAARAADLRVSATGSEPGLPLANPLGPVEFRLHPKAAALRELYTGRSLAIVHACGLTNATRSHFEAMDLMERGTPSEKSLTTGWLTRHLAAVGSTDLIPAVDVSASAPASLLGSTTAVALPDVTGFILYGDEWLTGTLRRFYAGITPLHRAGQRTLAAVEAIGKRVQRDKDGNPLPYQPSARVVYPADGDGVALSASLQTVARLIKMDVGLQVATLDYGGWDTHENQVYVFPNLVDGLSRALAAFYNDLARYHDRLTVVGMSEFGRRLKANESGGTDHGHGNLMLVLGGNVNGGRMYGRWPGLATEQLDQGADLAITTDYRTVLSEIVVRRLGNPKLGVVFPTLGAYTPLGIVRGPDPKVDLSPGA